jgi:hypothetical protein
MIADSVRVSVAACAAAMVVVILTACSPLLPDPVETVERDLTPPQLLSIDSVAETGIDVRFSKKASFVSGTVRITPDLGDVTISGHGETISIRFVNATDIGESYYLEGTVRDEWGNTMRFLTRFYGFNPRIPEIVINEFTPRGSATNGEKVELVLVAGGNIGGLCLYNGTPSDPASRFVFPPLELEAGTYIVVHFRPEGVPEEIDETTHSAESGGRHATDHAWDYWVAEGGGLPSNNGVVSLFTTPNGQVLDAVVWSNRTSDSDTRYRGFGTRRMLDWVDEIVGLGGWGIGKDTARPEDMINPEGSTTTRSLNRDARHTDSDTRADWHIVPTLGSTFGSTNSEEVYEP